MEIKQIKDFINKLEYFINQYNQIDNPQKNHDVTESVLSRALNYVLSDPKLTNLFISCNRGNPILLTDFKDSVFTSKHFIKDMPFILKNLKSEILKLKIEKAIEEKQPVDLIIKYTDSNNQTIDIKTFSSYLILYFDSSKIEGHTLEEREKGQNAVISFFQIDIVNDVILH